MSRQRVVAVTLDAAGTLFAPAEPVGDTYRRLAARHGIEADAADLDRAFHAAFRRSPPLAFPGASGERLERAERAWWRSVVECAFAGAGAAFSERQMSAAFADAWEHYAGAAAWTVFPDVAPALDALAARGVRLAVVSNFDGRLRRVLAELGMTARFAAVVASTDAGFAKPDARIFAAALAALDARPEEAVHVGDDPVADVEGARAAGLGALRIARGSPLAAGVIDDLRALAGPSLAAALVSRGT